MFQIKAFEKDDIDRVIAFEQELRKQEPDTYYWEPDATYRKLLEQSFDDERFRTAMSFIAVKEEKVIGRIDASLISSRSDASCFSAYMDWICVLKSERHGPLSYDALRYCYNKYSKEMGIPVKSSHKARKTYISSLYSEGVNLNTIRALVGHTDERTTLHNYCFDRSESTEKIKLIERASSK